MPSLLRAAAALIPFATLASPPAHARSVPAAGKEETSFILQSPAIGGVRPGTTSIPPALRGSSVAAIAGGALVLDGDSGQLVRCDHTGAPLATFDVGPGAGQVLVDVGRELAYVADRSHDRIDVVSIARGGLIPVAAWPTGAEPYGLALTPDHQALLVTLVADQRLAAIDTATGRERWSQTLGPEPRGVSIAPDGGEAIVTFLTTGALARIELAEGEARGTSFVSLDPTTSPHQVFGNHFIGKRRAVHPSRADETDLPDHGRHFARNTFAAMHIAQGVTVVPHQVSTPQIVEGSAPRTTGYGGGGGFTKPVEHRLAFVRTGTASPVPSVASAFTSLHQPRAMAYAAGSDTLYVAGYGSDDVLALANASRTTVDKRWYLQLPGENACAPDGLAVDDTTGDVLVFCSLSRRLVRLSTGSDRDAPPAISMGPELTPSRLTPAQLRGKALFVDGDNARISARGEMACASCHPEGRSDGLSWFLQGAILQTPLLSGRLEGTHPFKWDGQDPTLRASLSNTVTRLGGRGLSRAQVSDLAAYVLSLPAPRPPTVADTSAAMRGRELFESPTAGCAGCHSGPMSTDGTSYPLAADLGPVDTPSLIGLAHSAPYYHDGSAATLEALVRDNATVHDMGDTASLDDTELSDLVAYLRTM